MAASRLEFWPDYEGVLLWKGGHVMAIDDVALPTALAEEARRWVADYDDAKLPGGEAADPDWLEAGRRLFRDLERALAVQGIELFADEDHWAAPAGHSSLSDATAPSHRPLGGSGRTRSASTY
jgi:hypothetical protein